VVQWWLDFAIKRREKKLNDAFGSLQAGDVFSARGRRVLLTGAAGHIGSVIAKVFALNGAEMFLTDINQAGLDEVCAECAAAGAKARAHAADLRSTDAMKALAQETLAFFDNRVDALIHCGGLTWSYPMLHEDDEAFDRHFQTSVRSFWNLARALLPSMKAAGGGSITVIASTHGHRADGACALYAASKAALLSMTGTLAGEFGADGIRVNSVSPGWILGYKPKYYWDRALDLIKPEFRAEAAEKVAGHQDELAKLIQTLPRVGRPEDVAMACLYLTSDAARFVTGADIVLDGGKTRVQFESRAGIAQMRRRYEAEDATHQYLHNLPLEYWLAGELPPWHHKRHK